MVNVSKDVTSYELVVRRTVDSLSFIAPFLTNMIGGCWPQISRGIEACKDYYPKSPTLYRYLNSGSWMGYAKNARELLSAVISEGTMGEGEAFNKLNDQVSVWVCGMRHKYAYSSDTCDV